MDDKFFSLHSPSTLQNQVTEGPSFDNKSEEFDDDKGAFTNNVNTYQAENQPKFFSVRSDENLMTSPLYEKDDYDQLNNSPKTFATDKSLTDRIDNGSSNFRNSLSKLRYNQRIQIIYEPMVHNLPNSQESMHNADMKKLGERQVSALNASIEQSPKSKKTPRSPSARKQSQQPPLDLNPFLRPDNSPNHLAPNARSRKSWLKVKERIKDLKLNPKKANPKIKMTHEKLYGGASSRVLDIIQDKAFVDNLKWKLLKKKTFRQAQPSKLVQILRKHTAKKQSSNEEHENLFKVLDQLKVLKQSLPTRLKAKLEDAILYSKHFLKILRAQIYQLAVTPFKPLGLFKIIWNSIVLLFILYGMIYIPFWIAFENKLMDRESAGGIIDTIQTVFFIVDIVISFHTAFYKDGTLVFDKRRIAVNYLKGWFTVDIISSFPYEEVINLALNDTEEKTRSHQNVVQILNLLKLIRVLRIVKIKKVLLGLQDYLQNRPVIHGLLSLLKLSFVIAFLAHWCACGWEYIATDTDGTDWIKLDTPDRYSLKDQYIGALYFSVTTMLTVGYGDIIPATTSQRVYLIFMMLLGGGVFGYIMSSIAIIIQSLEDEGSKIRRKIATLSYYLKKKGLSKDVQIEAKKYLDFVFEDQHRMNATENEMFNNLSQDIKNRILEQMNGKLLYENRVVVDNFSKKFLYFVSSVIEERRFSPGDHILDSSSTEYCLYYITKGAVNIYIPKVARPWYSLKGGDHFGETSFFVGQNDSLKAKSIEFSLVLCLSRDKFLKALENFPLDREAFCAIKDNLQVYKKHSILQLKCPVCDELDHLLEHCPKLRYMPDKEKVIAKHLREVAIMRKNFVRRYRLRFGPRRNLRALEEVANDIVKEYSHEIEDFNALNPEEEDDKFEESEQPYKHESPEAVLNRRSVISPSTSHLNFLVKHGVLPMNAKDRFVREIQQTRKSKRHSIALSGLMGGLSREIESPRRRSAAVYHHHDALAEFYGISGINEEFEFDKLMNFQIYFPHNNPVKVIERLNIKDKRIRQEPNEIRRLKYHLKRFFKAIDNEKDPKAKPSSRILLPDGAVTSKILEQQSNRTPPQGTAQDTSILH